MTGVHYGIHQDLNSYKLDYRFLIKVDMSKVTKKGSLLSFCNIIRKSTVTAFVFYCDVKHSDIPTASILPGQSQFVVCCLSVQD